jgi:hypothetical protein
LKHYDVFGKFNLQSKIESMEMGIPIYYYDPELDTLEIGKHVEYRINHIRWELSSDDGDALDQQIEMCGKVRHVTYPSMEVDVLEWFFSSGMNEDDGNGHWMLCLQQGSIPA